MKVRILTTPLMHASTATAFKLATKSMSAQNIRSPFLSKKLSRLDRFYPKKLGPHMVVFFLASPTGDNPCWKMGTNRRPGVNSGTNGRLVSEANCSCKVL